MKRILLTFFPARALRRLIARSPLGGRGSRRPTRGVAAVRLDPLPSVLPRPEADAEVQVLGVLNLRGHPACRRPRRAARRDPRSVAHDAALRRGRSIDEAAAECARPTAPEPSRARPARITPCQPQQAGPKMIRPGAVAQLGERCNRTAEVVSSILIRSTRNPSPVPHSRGVLFVPPGGRPQRYSRRADPLVISVDFDRARRNGCAKGPRWGWRTTTRRSPGPAWPSPPRALPASTR